MTRQNKGNVKHCGSFYLSRGFTLLETVMALSALTMILGGLWPLWHLFHEVSADRLLKLDTLMVAHNEMERVLAQEISMIEALSMSPYPVTREQRTYNVTWEQQSPEELNGMTWLQITVTDREGKDQVKFGRLITQEERDRDG